MDYFVALTVYVASLLGVLVSMNGMLVFKDSKPMVYFMVLTCLVFCGTLYLGGLMVQAVN